MRRVKMHDRDVNNSGRHGAVAKRDPRSHEFGLASATPTFPSRLGDSAKTCNASRCAKWSVRYRGVLRQQGLHPTFGPDLAHVSLHPPHFQA